MKGRDEAVFAVGAMMLALAVAVVTLELWNADLRVPGSYAGDGTLNLLVIKDVLENLWWFENTRLGAPNGLQLYDYPVANGETLNMLLFRVLGVGSDDPALVINLFFLLTFPLTALTAFLVLRRFGAEAWASLVCAVLYAALPYHFIRGEAHLFLTAYYGVPIGAYLAIAVLSGQELVGLRRRVAATVGLAALVAVASGSFYYSAFTAVLVVVSALLRYVATRERRPLLAGGLVLGALLAVSLVQLAPTLVYRAANGTNDEVAKRFTFESEVYSLKLTQLVLPLDDHRIDAVARLKRRYTERFPAGDARAATLGIVATGGLVWLLAIALSALVGRRPHGKHSELALLTLVAFLFATVGGLGTITALVWTNTRAWNRLSVFIAFFALAAVALGLGRLRSRFRAPVYVAVVAAVLVVGVLDQTTNAQIPPYDVLEADWRADAQFIRALERNVADGAKVVQLPYEPFPEPPAGSFNYGYEPAKAYIHSTDLRWSYGAMRGRDDWAAANASKPAPQLVAAARRADFAGILLDRIPYGAQAQTVEGELQRLLGSPPTVSANRRWVYFRL
jgi:hypothetical protein